MEMRPEVKAALLRRKRKDAIDVTIMCSTILGVVLLVSWVERHLFDFGAPWIRIVAIVLAWIGAGIIFWRALFLGRYNALHDGLSGVRRR